ncbi:ParB N-terminal domain-containing protein, partial [Pseudoflavonifractor phocaeensis]|uniref:ParB N-terminal domain-containing protein n=1 Tax=Pseudoflavonifractor phocaeensis TaxID=1870988 RepID=UPI00210AC12A
MAEDKKVQEAEQAAVEVKLSEIADLPFLPVHKVSEKELGGMVLSVKMTGVQEPVLLRVAENGGYQMVSGYKRMWASQYAQKATIPAYIREMTLNEARQYAVMTGGKGHSTPDIPLPGKPYASPTPGEDGEKKSKGPNPPAPVLKNDSKRKEKIDPPAGGDGKNKTDPPAGGDGKGKTDPPARGDGKGKTDPPAGGDGTGKTN